MKCLVCAIRGRPSKFRKKLALKIKSLKNPDLHFIKQFILLIVKADLLKYL